MEKLIGIFQENCNGVETETFGELKDRLGLIGNLSQDAGGIELYYDNKGVTYAIAHDSEAYYGKNENNSNIAEDKSSGAVNEATTKNLESEMLRRYLEERKKHINDENYSIPLYIYNIDSKIDEAVDDIIEDLSCLDGGNEWRNIDKDVENIIKQKWRRIINTKLHGVDKI